MSAQPLMTVDDRDPQVLYSSNVEWVQSGIDIEYDGTTTFTKAANGSVTFEFNGTSVAVYGAVSNSTDGPTSSKTPPQTNFTIDGAPPTLFAPALLDLPQRGLMFFANLSLAPVQHKLVISTLVPGAFFCLDRIDYTPIDIDIVGPTVIPDSPYTIPDGPTLSHGCTTHSSLSTATIVGIILACLNLLFIVMLILYSVKFYHTRNPPKAKTLY